ncbi:MAG TPA: 3-oxoadipate enol-lactonase [Chloroflexota bacterium]|nr:3-oxoadipate enol-lactonase [Chloroflexota bacterium]
MTERRLAYSLDGPAEAPVLVLSGSLGSTQAMWEPQMPALTARRRILRLDHPGHGASPVWEGPVTVADIARAVLELLDGLGCQHFAFCGLSLGGAIGQWVAAHAPERVRHLILCSTTSHFEAETYLQRAALVRRDGLGQVAAAVMDRWFTPGFRAQEPATVAHYRAMVASIPPDGYAECCEAVARFDGRPDLSRISAPTLVLVGAEDPVVSPGQARALQDGISRARLEIVEAASHLFNIERPEETSRAILRQLAEDEDD